MNTTDLTDWWKKEGFFWPDCEKGVLMLFGYIQKRLGFRVLVVTKGFPDALIEWNRERSSLPNGLWRTEFEYRSSNFFVHRHDPENCDLVICWEHDRTDFPLPVLELWTLKLFRPNGSQERLSLSEEF